MTFDEWTKELVWNKARRVLYGDPDEVRQDDYGNEIHRREYGNRHSEFGWEIDHITPLSADGINDISNLRALHWRTNLRRGLMQHLHVRRGRW